MTTQERKNLYKKMYRIIKWNPFFKGGFCKLLNKLGLTHTLLVDFNSILSDKEPVLAELYRQRPSGANILDHWWGPGLRKPRLQALKAAIEECDRKITEEKYQCISNTLETVGHVCLAASGKYQYDSQNDREIL